MLLMLKANEKLWLNKVMINNIIADFTADEDGA